MKKLLLICLMATVTVNFVGCKNKKEKDTKKTQLSVEAKTTTINWTAYKTTDKVPVKGNFSELEIIKSSVGATVKEALNGVEFKIPTNSIFTNDTIRDGKLRNFFFNQMMDAGSIKGKINIQDEKTGTVELGMNGVSEKLPITYNVDGQKVNIEATMNLESWKTQAAIIALNKACEDLHKGADGISKTWNEVKIEAVAYLKAE